MMYRHIFPWVVAAACVLWGLMPLAARAADPPRLRVLATTTFLADMARNIAGPYADVVALLPAGTDPHTYEPVPADAQRAATAEVIFCNGLTLEGWLAEMIDNAGGHAAVVTVSDGVAPIQSAQHAGAFDPHAWMSVPNAVQYCRNMAAALAEADPAHAAAYGQQLADYTRRLDTLDAYIFSQIGRLPAHRRVLITSHDAFRYYGTRYGLRVEAVLGTTTEAEVNPADLTHLAGLVRELGIPAVFVESTINPKLLAQFAGDLHIGVGGKLYADALGGPGSGAETYVDMLRQNTDTIVAGLGGAPGSAAAPPGRHLWAVVGLFSVAFVGMFVRLWRRPGEAAVAPGAAFAVEVEGLWVRYGEALALAPSEVRLASGHVYGVLGSNGSGKSTLLKAILGLVPSGGAVQVGGHPLAALRGQIAYVPQRGEIDWQFPATVRDVVGMGRYASLGVAGRMSAADRAQVQAAIDKLGLTGLADRAIGALSGGQQQRVFIARALCQDALCYFLDEPFVGVDMATEEKIVGILRELATAGKLVVVVHHDLSTVARYFDRIVLMNKRVVAEGPVADVFTPGQLQALFGAPVWPH